MLYRDDLQRATALRKTNKAFLSKLKRLKPKKLDEQFHELHHNVFNEIDCLECANCCKTTSPIFLISDIEKLSKIFKLKVSEFIETYLTIDEEGDYVLRQSPCPFLGADNKCIVYEGRPKACREYPHTDRKRMYQITSLTFRNTMVCPAVSKIVEHLKAMYQ